MLYSNDNQRLTLMSDAWTNLRSESIINYVLVTAEGNSIFHSSDPSHTDRHTAEYLASHLKRIIREVGPEKINAICTDTAANMKAAVALVKKDFPHVHTIGCASHQLNLVIKDIPELPSLKTTLGEAVEVSKWFRNHQVPLATLKERQMELYKKHISLSLPVPTRWQSNSKCLKSLIDSKDALLAATVSPVVSTIMAQRNYRGASVGARVKAHILDDHCGSASWSYRASWRLFVRRSLLWKAASPAFPPSTRLMAT